MKSNVRYLVRVEAATRGYLKVSSTHRVFKTEDGAWNYIERMKKKHPECECYIAPLMSAKNRQYHLNLSETTEPDGLDF